jgi:hypothetical protein
MARIIVLEGDDCLWNVLRDILQSEGYTVVDACNDYEGFSQDDAGLALAVQTHNTRYLCAY